MELGAKFLEDKTRIGARNIHSRGVQVKQHGALEVNADPNVPPATHNRSDACVG